MSIFYQEEPSNPSKKCKCLASLLKDAFTKCHSFRCTEVADSTLESEDCATNLDEDEIFVSAIISKYMESKSKRKSGVGIESFKWALSPEAGDYFKTTPKSFFENYNANNLVEVNGDEFRSANSRLSRCSSDTSFDAFCSARTCFSRCSSLSRIENNDFLSGDRRSIIMELVGCEGWPFGLCRKALFLPPLPKSPADSWSWRKGGKVIRIH
ncbi:glycine--tRNA ligase beta subunit [Striga asiatica]|uniref:Glycine--tRNA ligase beta subunit n=1 Tax=Striga asiatica TaxID=4170 RepID=A0A5A7PAU8_STRAF|nr:glycine--tRNA ligase beta subunit [Striga asiatica]